MRSLPLWTAWHHRPPGARDRQAGRGRHPLPSAPPSTPGGRAINGALWPRSRPSCATGWLVASALEITDRSVRARFCAGPAGFLSSRRRAGGGGAACTPPDPGWRRLARGLTIPTALFFDRVLMMEGDTHLAFCSRTSPTPRSAWLVPWGPRATLIARPVTWRSSVRRFWRELDPGTVAVVASWAQSLSPAADGARRLGCAVGYPTLCRPIHARRWAAPDPNAVRQLLVATPRRQLAA